jgi:nitroreductase
MAERLIDFLLQRRSVKPAMLTEPGPTPAELDTILTAATRVPDHKKLAPWRFIIFEGEARRDFGRVLEAACRDEEKEAPSAIRLEAERGRLLRAPTVIAVISAIIPNRAAPEWEQVLSCGAACFSLCLAANALGYGTSWITEWYSYSPGVRGALRLAANERIAGFVYIGTAKEPPPDRDRPALTSVVSRWQG